MAVSLKLASGEERIYRDGVAAHLKEPLFVVSAWDKKRRKLEDLDVFPAEQVAWAEVSENGHVTDRIAGRGRVQSS